MPNIQSNRKHLRKSIKRQAYNRSIKSRLKTVGSKMLSLLNDQKIDEAKVLLKNFYKLADKANNKGVLKKNTVARKKSKLAKKVYGFDVKEKNNQVIPKVEVSEKRDNIDKESE